MVRVDTPESHASEHLLHSDSEGVQYGSVFWKKLSAGFSGEKKNKRENIL